MYKLSITMKNKIAVKNIEIDEIFTSEVKPHGNGARIPFFRKFMGKKVFIIIPKEDGKK